MKMQAVLSFTLREMHCSQSVACAVEHNASGHTIEVDSGS